MSGAVLKRLAYPSVDVEDPPGNRIPGPVAMAAALLLLCLTSLHGQEHFLEVTPSLAQGFFPSAALTVVTPDGTRLESQLEDALGAGLRVSARPVGRFSLVLEGILIDNAQSSTSGAVAAQGFSADVGTSYGVYGAAVRYHPDLFSPRVEPFVAAGVGKKEFEIAFTPPESGLTGSFGAGLTVEISGWPDLRTEVRDYVSSFEPSGQVAPDFEVENHVQHDVFWTLGAVFGLF